LDGLHFVLVGKIRISAGPWWFILMSHIQVSPYNLSYCNWFSYLFATFYY